MSKKLLNKVISAILVLAICSTAFLGGVVSAETTKREGTYAIVGNVYSEETDTVTADVTINSTTPFVAGIFTVTAPELTFTGIKAIEGVNGESTIDAPSVWSNTESNNKVLFASFGEDDDLTAEVYTSITLRISFSGTGIEAGKLYNVNISDIDVTNLAEEHYNIPAVADSTIHIHKFEEIETENTDVITYDCTVCDAQKYAPVKGTKIDETVEEVDMERGLTIGFPTTGDITLEFTTDIPDGDNVYLAILEDDGETIKQLVATSGKIEDETVGIVDGFVNTYKNGVKAIGEAIKAIFVTVDDDGKILTKSKLMEESVASYCLKILGDDKTENADIYCKALLNYAKAAAEYFNYESEVLENLDENYIDSYDDLAPFEDDSAYNDVKGSGWYFASANVVMEAKPVLRLAVKVTDTEKVSEDFEFKVNYDGGYKTFKRGELEEGKNGIYYIYIDDMATKYLRNVVSIHENRDGYSAEITTNVWGTYSVESYAKRMADTDVGNLAKMLMAYSDALNGAFGTQG